MSVVGRGLRVVVADREADQRALLRLALHRDPTFAVVAEAADGPGAVALSEEHDAEVLVLDADLPHLDGVGVVRALADTLPRCASVFVTSVDAGDLRAAGAVGVVDRATSVLRLATEVRAAAAAAEAADVGRTAAVRSVGADVQAPRAARRFVDEVLTGAGYADVLDTVELLVTEVVTNAVVHARSEARVVVQMLPGAVRVEVHDDDDSFPVRRRPSFDAPGGRGLELVEQLSRSWGIDMLEVGKRTWFEVAREEAP